MKRTLTVLVCLLFLASVLGVTAVVSAPKPDKPPKPPGGGGGNIPPGTLYFSYYDGSDFSVWSMNADGSAKTKLTLIDCSVEFLSKEKHGDHYWYIGFCEIEGETYPDGLPRQEIFASRDDNARFVQLTDDPMLAPNHNSRGPFWRTGDVSVTWGAKTWVCDPDCYLDANWAGVFEATLNYDASGDITGADAPTLIWWTELTQDSDGYWRPRTGHWHDWSPDGAKFVWQRQGIQVVDLVMGTETWITNGHGPMWSPDGSKIAFTLSSNDLRTINPDGSGEQIIYVPRDTNRGWYTVNAPRWSPDSNYLSFRLHFFDNHKWINKDWIYRIDVNGDGAVSLTNDLPASAIKQNVGWR